MSTGLTFGCFIAMFLLDTFSGSRVKLFFLTGPRTVLQKAV
jgi:hypothetical protein